MTIDQAMQVALQHHQAGRLPEAERIYRQILSQLPEHANATHYLGVLAYQLGRYESAIELINSAIERSPGDAACFNNLGEAYRLSNRKDEAIHAYRQAIRLDPSLTTAYGNLGVVLRDQHRLDEAIAILSKAIVFSPANAEARNNLGVALRDKGEPEKAIDLHKKAIALKPDYAVAHYNLGLALNDRGNLDEAVAAYSKCIQLQPDLSDAYVNLGTTRMNQGLLDEALACADRALSLRPDATAVASNRLYTLLFHPRSDARTILAEHRRWDSRYARASQAEFQSHKNDPAPDRRLRIGYVGPDFRDHVIGRNLLPLFRESDHQAMEIFCYSDVVKPDSFTEFFRSRSDHWRDTAIASHQNVSQQILADRIDVLVDLTLHMAGNRLAVFRERPAPVQVTWLGYPGTTGLAAMEYRLTDPYLDPPGEGDGDYVEQSIRLPHSFVCYDEEAMTMGIGALPQVAPLPALANGHVTFGSLNNFCKINDPLLALWTQVLRAVSGSRLVLLAHEGSHRGRTFDWFANNGIDPARVQFVRPCPRRQYLEYNNLIDIGLDTLPYGGYTTSLDSYWMGVPVVTLAGKTVVGRAGVSHVMNLGLPELLAHTPKEYVEIATNLASNLPRLSELRAGLRDRLRSSPLSDARRFARDIEGAYREMWRRWCAKHKSPVGRSIP